MEHLDFEKLVNNFEGALPAAEMQMVSEHLQNCPQCANEAKKLEKFFSYAQQNHPWQLPQAVTAYLLNIFKQRKESVETPFESFGRRLLANLVFDDWQTVVHERLADSETRQMLFEAGEFQIDLRVQFTAGKCEVSGQIFPGCGLPAAAELSSAAHREKISLNDDCEFVFPLLPEGIYKLQLNLGGTIVEIENISLVN